MYLYLLVLRIVHIACGVFWAGTAIFMVFYIFPAAKKAGADGGKIMQAVTGTNKFPEVVVLTAFITVIAGVLLIWHLSAGFTFVWVDSSYGIALSIGGVTALIAFLQALLINMPAIRHTKAISRVITVKGGNRPWKSGGTLMALRKRNFFSTRLIAFCLR